MLFADSNDHNHAAIGVRNATRMQERMDDFSITRPEAITPAGNAGGHGSLGNDARQQRRPRPAPEPVTPEPPEEPHEEDNSHEIDELV
jgi:hypothetical protein